MWSYAPIQQKGQSSLSFACVFVQGERHSIQDYEFLLEMFLAFQHSLGRKSGPKQGPEGIRMCEVRDQASITPACLRKELDLWGHSGLWHAKVKVLCYLLWTAP